MDHTQFGVQLIAPLPIFGALPRDQLIVRVGHPDPLTLIRDLPPNYGAIAEAIAAGTAFPLNPRRLADELLRLLTSGEALPWPPPAPHPGRQSSPSRPARHLFRLK